MTYFKFFMVGGVLFLCGFWIGVIFGRDVF